MSYSIRNSLRVRPLSFEEIEKRLCLSSVSFVSHDILTKGASQVFPSDIDADGDIDLLIASWSDGVRWYENVDGRGAFSEQHRISQVVVHADIVMALDMDGDQDVDVVARIDGRPFAADSVVWYENLDGKGNYGNRRKIESLKHINSFDIADLDGDSDLDVLVSVSDLGLGAIAWYENVDASFERHEFVTEHRFDIFSDGMQTFVPIGSSTGVHAGDVDGDGDLDVLANPGSVITWQNNLDGKGEFSERTVIEETERFKIDLIAQDVDGDGDLDVVIASQAEVRWYENLGMGRFDEATIVETQMDDLGEGIGSLFGDDVDGDGDQDLLAVSRNRGVLWYDNTDGQGNFGPPQVVERRGSTRPISVADIDGDGDSDIISARPGRITWSEKVVIGDSNRDGRFDSLDLVQVLQAAEYEDGIRRNSTFEEGDWNGDGDFNKEDIVFALQAGTFVATAQPDNAAIDFLCAEDED